MTLVTLKNHEAILSKYSIDGILKQGYTLTTKNGKIVKSGSKLENGDIIKTRFLDCEVDSIVKK